MRCGKFCYIISISFTITTIIIIIVKAKFHYASWFGAGSELKFGLSSSLLAAKLARASRFAATFHHASWFGAGSKLVRIR